MYRNNIFALVIFCFSTLRADSQLSSTTTTTTTSATTSSQILQCYSGSQIINCTAQPDSCYVKLI